MGSWKIMEIFPPRIFRIWALEYWVRSSPSKRIFPSLILAVSARSFKMDIEVTLFPLPDSPTSPTISPLPTEKLTPRTAWTSPLLVMKDVFKFSICKIGSICISPICGCYFLSFGSRASRSPSPTKLKANMIRQITRAGMNSW